MLRTSPPLLAVLPWLAMAASAQDWRPTFPAVQPGARSGARMAYDASAGELVLFGGQVAPNPSMADTWSWNGTSWRQRSPASAPSGRQQHEMCTDPLRNRIVLYGGLQGTAVLGDTWEWDGATWTQVTPLVSPPPRAYGALAFSGANVFLFGGGSSSTPRNDLWIYDGLTWVQVPTANAPSPRYYHSLASNGQGELLLFGGFNPNVGYSNQTWRFDGANWNLVPSPVSPSPRGNAHLVWDGTRYLLWGGTDSVSTELEDTWVFARGQWAELTTATSPSSRSRAAAAWFPDDQRFVLYGGSSLTQSSMRNEVMWEFGRSLASIVRWGPSACPALDPPALLPADRQPILGSTFQMRLQSVAAMYGMVIMGFSTTTWSGGQLPFDLAALGGWPNCLLLVSPEASSRIGFGNNLLWSHVIPSLPSLVGQRFHLQGFTFGFGGFPSNMAAANAATGVVGQY